MAQGIYTNRHSSYLGAYVIGAVQHMNCGLVYHVTGSKHPIGAINLHVSRGIGCRIT